MKKGSDCEFKLHRLRVLLEPPSWREPSAPAKTEVRHEPRNNLGHVGTSGKYSFGNDRPTFGFTGTIGHRSLDKQASRPLNLKQKFLLFPAERDSACEELHRPSRCFG